MKRSSLLSILLLAMLFLAYLQVSHAGSREIMLFDAPRGSWLATLRADTSWEVLEDRAGWRRVRIEGWIPGSSHAAAVPQQEAPPAAGGETETVSGIVVARPENKPPSVDRPASKDARGGTTVSGVLLPEHGDRTALPGAGLVVLLVGDLERLDEAHERAGADCLADLEISQRHIDEKKAELDEQLNSSDNFREAANRHDRVQRELKRAEEAHREKIEECRRSADAIFRDHTLQKVISDPAGQFEFDHVPDGNYRVVATEIGGERPRSWALECAVAGEETIVLDPRSDRSRQEPYWGLNRPDGAQRDDD